MVDQSIFYICIIGLIVSVFNIIKYFKRNDDDNIRLFIHIEIALFCAACLGTIAGKLFIIKL